MKLPSGSGSMVVSHSVVSHQGAHSLFEDPFQWPLAGLARASASTCAQHPIIRVSTHVHVHVHGVYRKIIILPCGFRSEVTRLHHQAESEDHRDFPALVYHRKLKETHSKNMYVPCYQLNYSFINRHNTCSEYGSYCPR